MTKLEWTLWVVAAAISIAGILLAIFQYLNRQGGRKKKVVRKALLLTLCITLLVWVIGLFFFISDKHVTVSVGDSPLNSDTQLFLVYGLTGMDYPSALAIPFWVENDGDQTIENLTITLTYNSDFVKPILESQIGGLGSLELIDRKTHTYQGITSSTIQIKSINPGQRFYCAEPFILTTEYLDQLKQLVYPNITINIRISAQEIPVWNSAVTVSAVSGSSFDEIAFNHIELSGSTKTPSEIIVVVSPFRFTEYESQKMYASDSLRIRTKVYRFAEK